MLQIGREDKLREVSQNIKSQTVRFPLSHLRPLSDLYLGIQALKLTKERGFDVVVSADPSLLWWLRFAKKQKKVVLYLNTLHCLAAKSTRSWIKYIYLLLSEMLIRSYISKCMVLSKSGEDYAKKNLKLFDSKIQYFLPNTFDSLDISGSETIKSKYNIPDDAFLITSISRLEKEKGVDRLVQYLSGIQEETYCLIIGSGSQEGRIREMSQKIVNTKFVFTGPICHDRIGAFIKASDVLVQLSRSESLGLSVLEAMYLDVPVIASPVGGLCDSIGLVNQRGFLVADKSKFLQAVTEIRMKSERLEEITKSARQYVVNKLSLFKSINQLFNQ